MRLPHVMLKPEEPTDEAELDVVDFTSTASPVPFSSNLAWLLTLLRAPGIGRGLPLRAGLRKSV
jgi:hypothetical protein